MLVSARISRLLDTCLSVIHNANYIVNSIVCAVILVRGSRVPAYGIRPMHGQIHIVNMHGTGPKHIVRHSQKSVVQWSVISKFTCIFNRILKEMKCPKQWKQVKIKSIYKNKGKKEDLANQRGIFLTSNVQKAFERIILKRIYAELDKSMTEFQNGARRNRSSNEHLYTMRAAIDYYEYLNIPLIIQFYDLEKCFDRLWLKKCMTRLWESGVQGPTWRIIYEMNKSAEIKIETPVGETEPIQIHEVVMQGTVLAALICANMIDTVTETIKNVGGGIKFGRTKITSLIFQDDILQPAVTEDRARRAAMACETFQDANRMRFNMKKTQMMTLRAKKGNGNKIQINKQEMTECTEYKYLGDHLNEKNNYKTTIEKRTKQANIDNMETMAITREMNIPEREIQIRLKLLETITIPKIYFNSETWTNLTKCEIEKIDNIVSGSLKKLIGLPRTTPTLGLYAETGIAPARHHIAQKKLMLLHRIKSGEPQKLINKIYEEQKEMDLPKCWYQEIKTIKQKYRLNNISDNELGAMSKAKWKNIVKKAIQNELQNELESASEVKKKLKDIKIFGKKEYIDSMESKMARLAFKYRLNMSRLATNYKAANTNMCCPLCKREEDNYEHMAKCSEYRQMDRILRVSDLYSEDVREVRRATEAIKERMDYRCAQPDSSETAGTPEIGEGI